MVSFCREPLNFVSLTSRLNNGRPGRERIIVDFNVFRWVGRRIRPIIAAFEAPKIPYIGDTVGCLENIKMGALHEIDNVDVSRYQTCRGPASVKQLDTIFELVMDPSADEDLRDEALCDGLWDHLIHQYTLYSVTPIALYRFLKCTTREERAAIPDANSFVEVCGNSGTHNVFLTVEEIQANARGELPIYSIEEILEKYA